MNSRRFPSPRKPLWKLRITTQTPSLTLARPKIRLARIEPTKPAGAGVVVRVIMYIATFYNSAPPPNQSGSPVSTQPAQLLSWHQARGHGAAFCNYRRDCQEDSMKYHFQLMEAWEDKAGDRKKMGLPTALVV
ncbi:hypothetical protein AVEN_137800-1 [Araneus ventricosus]|uniref:Uncharacterized protein n=1 Tax=Araneus ventricosus TaxID=182803 RepID=A0A4Y2PJ08_ARAVE|nr:hypothetical protein AVEN_137800-1 [Araneus ventricosus]